ncbi:hypothetical protein HY480_01960 [Candidatus Uhrbacteria bacterium]|nr:hypothetical protein [Candidatus Uhrbacteria bacterium]
MVCDGIVREDIVRAWTSFVRGKEARNDVRVFAWDLEANLEQLYQDLVSGRYRHGSYRIFTRCDPKPRMIAVPSVRDQVVHHAIVQTIGPAFERRFHPHSYASRPGKGVLAGVEAVHRWIREVSDGGRTRAWALRMDVRRYFASVDHAILTTLIARQKRGQTLYATGSDPFSVGEPWLDLCRRVVGSFGEVRGDRKYGIPLGNLTSQLFANIYLHELDGFVAHTLHVRRYARYMDDAVLVGGDRDVLTTYAAQCRVFLRDVLHLEVPEEKTSITPVHRGVDWLGYVLFPHHRVLRPVTLRRMRDRIRSRTFAYLDDGLPRERFRATVASYDGMLCHAHHEQERERLALLDRCVG